MEELQGLLVELQELCKRRRSLDVPGQCLAPAEGAGLGVPEAFLLPTFSHQPVGLACEEP